MEPLRHRFEIRILVSYHDGLGVIEHRVNIADHELRYVRNVVENEIPVRAHQAGNIHVLIVDAQIVSLSNQAFNNFNQRALPQIVCPSFKTEAKYSHSLVSSFHDQVQAAIYMYFIAWEN